MNGRRIALLADFSCRAFWFYTTTVTRLDGGNARLINATLLMGKGAFDEQHPNFVGTYSAGAGS